MIAVLRPIVFSFLGSKRFHKFVVEILEAIAQRTDNKLDDTAVAVIKKHLIGN